MRDLFCLSVLPSIFPRLSLSYPVVPLFAAPRKRPLQAICSPCLVSPVERTLVSSIKRGTKLLALLTKKPRSPLFQPKFLNNPHPVLTWGKSGKMGLNWGLIYLYEYPMSINLPPASAHIAAAASLPLISHFLSISLVFFTFSLLLTLPSLTLT